AAAYAAAAGSSTAESRPAARQDAAARSAAPLRAPSDAEPAARSSAAADEARLSELVGLLAAEAELPAPAPAHGRSSLPRATVVRSARDAPPAFLDDEDDDGDHHVDRHLDRHLDHLDHVDDELGAPPEIAPAAPSPFTAALARMVSGDRDVRQAVEEALEHPATASSSPTDVGPWPTWSGPIRTAEPSVPSPPARQKEETVGNPVIAPPSMPAARPAEVPAWAAGPDAAMASSREEAIAEVLRSALAQGHSDEALAGILRKVLAGASPQTALDEPIGAEADLPQRTPVRDHVALPNAVAHLAPEDAAEPAPVPARAVWEHSASQSTLWGESPAVPAHMHADSPIWAEVVRREPVQPPAAEQAGWSLLGTVPATPAEPVAAAPVAAEPAPAQPVVPDTAVPDAVVAEPVPEASSDEDVAEPSAVEQSFLELAPLLARTASDPAPMSLDATTVMPPLSLLPPLPGTRGRGRGRPPVPSVAPRSSSAPQAAEAAPSAGAATAVPASPQAGTVAAPAVAVRSLATVTRLPVAPLMATPETPDLTVLSDLTELLEPAAAESAGESPIDAPAADVPADLPADQPVVRAEASVAPEVVAVPAAAPAARPIVRPTRNTAAGPGDVVAQLEELGVPSELLGNAFAEEVAALGTYAALTGALDLRLPPAPELPTGAGEVLFLVGPGVETLRAARSLAASLRLAPERVQWATRGDLAGLAPEGSRMATIDAAIDRRQAAARAGTLTIVAVDAPLRTDAYWMAQMLAIWSPVAVWAVVEATRKPEDLEPWLEGLSRVDALVVQDTDLSADPAAVLRRVTVPVAVLDGVRATPHRWASLLCERLEGAES
ncbi:MAG: uncharacterized protein JWQ45_1109, partial [Blastococcus sp.]|nr:uncharacterized protein [Blastococcus sp.]